MSKANERVRCPHCNDWVDKQHISTRGGKWPRTIHESVTGFCVSTRYMGSYFVPKRGVS